MPSDTAPNLGVNPFIVDENGRPMRRDAYASAPSSNQRDPSIGKTEHDAIIGRIRLNISFLNWAAAALLAAGVAGFFVLDDRINARFDKLDERNQQIGDSLATIRAENARQSAIIESLGDRTN